MKFKFSTRDLLITVFVVAGLFWINHQFNSWRQTHLETEFREYQTLANLQSIRNGDQLPSVQLLFNDLRPLHPEIAKVALSRELTEVDEVFTVTVNKSFARFLQFQEGTLINHEFSEQDRQDAMNSLQTPAPQWYIKYGQWLIGAMYLLIVVLIRVMWGVLFGKKIEEPKRSAHDVGGDSSN